MQNDCLISCIIAKLVSIQESRSRCVAAIQAIPTASFQSPLAAIDANDYADDADDDNQSNDNDHTQVSNSSDEDANIILLATILLHKFIKHSNHQSNTAIDIAIVQARMAQLLTQILMTDKAILERTINNISTNISSSSHIHTRDKDKDNNTNVKKRDAKTLLSKTILATLATTLHSYQHFTTTSIKANTSGNSKANAIKISIQRNLSSLESLLFVAKRKVTPFSSSNLHIPVTSQHAHSIPMNSQGEHAWNSLLTLLEGEDSGTATTTVTATATATGATAGEGTYTSAGAGVHLGNSIRTECQGVSTWLDSLDGSNLNISKKKGKKTKDLGGNEVEHKGSIQWMKPFVGLDDGSGREDVQDVTPVRRKKRSKSGTHPDPPVAAETVDIRTTNGSGSGSTTNSCDAVAEEMLMHELLNGNVFEGRITVKKLASMAFVHCCAGQYHLLRGLVSLLEDSEENKDEIEVISENPKSDGEEGDVKMETDVEGVCWKDVMGVGNVMEWSNVSSSSLPSTKRDTNGNVKIRAMPSLILSVLVVRIVDIIQESGKLCGTFPTKNGMEDYIQGLYDAYNGVIQPEKVGGDSGGVYSAQLGNRTKRPNIYNLVICVLRLMILNHGQCLKDIAILSEECSLQGNESKDFPFDLVVGQDAGDGPVVAHILINEEELVKTAIIKEYSYYNPVVHKTIETLIRCGSTSYSSSERKDCKILYGFAAAFALKASVVKHHCEPHKQKRKGIAVDSIVVVDAKLCSFAVHYLTEILENIVAFTKNSFRGDEVDKGASMNADMIGHFHLDNPIVPDQTLNQSGLFTDTSRNDFNRVEKADEKGWRNGFLFSLFFRALLPTNKKATKASLIKTPFTVIDAMMNAVKVCYSVVPQDIATIAVGNIKKK